MWFPLWPMDYLEVYYLISRHLVDTLLIFVIDFQFICHSQRLFWEISWNFLRTCTIYVLIWEMFHVHLERMYILSSVWAVFYLYLWVKWVIQFCFSDLPYPYYFFSCLLVLSVIKGDVLKFSSAIVALFVSPFSSLYFCSLYMLSICKLYTN